MSSQTINLGLVGFGCVGQGLYDVLQATPGIKANIKKIVVKDRYKRRSLPDHYFIYDFQELLQDPTIDTIVELIDDADVAYQIAFNALQNGKNFISANKKMLALHLPELQQIAAEQNVSLLYEGAACGSIPIIRNLEEYYDNDLLHGLTGIFNGSSNYILTKMSHEGTSYKDALLEAQAKGFAESDPSLDVEGFDATYKAVILALHSFGVYVLPDHILRLGIQNLKQEDLKFASANLQTIKPTARIFKIDDRHFTIYVLPELISIDNPLSKVDREYNAVSIQAAFSDRQLLIGKGAGGHPTGSAVLSDIAACSYQYKYEFKKVYQGSLPQFTTDIRLSIYASSVNPIPEVFLNLIQVEESGQKKDFHYIKGTIDVADLMNQTSLIQENQIFIGLCEH
jgi:homoserine dehydrogenase